MDQVLYSHLNKSGAIMLTQFVCIGVKFLTFNILLHTKAVPKAIINILFTICVRRVLFATEYFFKKKTSF